MALISDGGLLIGALRRTGKWATSVAFFGGVISDILNPYAPFAAYIALTAAVAAALLAIAALFRLLHLDKALPALVFALATTIVSGGIWALQKSNDTQNGIIADLVPAIAGLQQSIGLVAANVEEIGKKVSETQKSVEAVKEITAKIDSKTDEIASAQAGLKKKADEAATLQAQIKAKADEAAAAQAELKKKAEEAAAAQAELKRQNEEAAVKAAETAKRLEAQQIEAAAKAAEAAKKLEEQNFEIAAKQEAAAKEAEAAKKATQQIAASIETIADGFKQLGSQGGIIADPVRPEQHYHNARVHELGGDMLNARKSYVAFASFGVDAIDPYLRLATLLKVQEGKASAREVLGALKETNKSPALSLAHLSQFEDQQRAEKLDAFIAANPAYGPAYFSRAEEFSEDRLGSRSLADKRSEAEALDKFLSFEKDGGLNKHFVDQAFFAEWLDRAHSRRAAVADVLDPAKYQPTLNPMPTNGGWSMNISLPEPASSISWRMGSQGEFTQTGTLEINDPATGKKMPNPNFMLPESTPAGTISVKYQDLKGREVGPFELPFQPGNALEASQKQMLDQFWTSWIAFDASGNTGLVYFTQIVSMRCGQKETKYGLNGAEPDKALDMPPCDPKNPYAMPDDFQPYFIIAGDVKSMKVQITYADGSLSPVREFLRQ